MNGGGACREKVGEGMGREEEEETTDRMLNKFKKL